MNFFALLENNAEFLAKIQETGQIYKVRSVVNVSEDFD